MPLTSGHAGCSQNGRGVPNPMLRVPLGIVALVAALLMVGVGTGTAYAAPDDGDDTSETGAPADPPPAAQPTVNAPEPVTAAPPSIFDIPRNIANQLRDLVGRPLSTFGNGRIPGTHTVPDATTVPGGANATTARNRTKPPATPPKATVPEPVPPAPVEPVQARRWAGSSVTVIPPFSGPPVTVPVPDLPVPGYRDLRWTLDLSDPTAALTSVGQTLNTVNSLLADAYAPFNPFKPPPPKPAPSFRITEEEPVDVGGVADVESVGDGSDLPVVQAPMIVAPMFVAAPRPVTGAPGNAAPVSAGAAGRAAAAGSAGASATAGGGSAPPRATPAEPGVPNGAGVGMGNPALREGYPSYLRSARLTQVATVALPGLAGLIALVAGGGVIGYRQANSGRFLRSEAERFLQ